MVLVFLLAAALAAMLPAAFFGVLLGRYLPRWPLPILAVMGALVTPFAIVAFLTLILPGSSGIVHAILYMVWHLSLYVGPAAVLIGGPVAYYAAAWGKGCAQETFE